MSNPFTRKEVTKITTDFKDKVNDYRPQRRLELISKQAKLRELKLESTKKAKTALVETQKSSKLQSLFTKFQRFEWRMNKPVRTRQELNAVIKGWLMLGSVTGSLTVLHRRFMLRKVQSR
jgi:hypothetical protein